jgi:uncharacterized repeat protein (TIGR03843 family)
VDAVTGTTHRRLQEAPLEVLGRFADASNATLLVRLRDRDPRSIEDLAEELGHTPSVDELPPEDLAVHKPRRGEAPLWDFPSGSLHRREVAAFEVSDAAGWGLVPATVLREDGPFGPGSLQRFVPHDPEQHYFWLLEQHAPAVVDQLVTMIVFDLAIGNADRKGGHVLLEVPPADAPPPPVTPRLQVVDHGVSFHVEHKLRTVAWDLAGTPLPARLRDDLGRLLVSIDGGDLGERLRALLTDDEVAAFRRRVVTTAALPCLPDPIGPRPYPWPML